MPPLSRDEIIIALQAILQEKPRIIAAYLFGSFVRDDGRSARDVDIGLLVDDQALRDPWFAIRLGNELEDAIPAGRPFDVRVLNKASIPFCYNAIFRTPLLVSRDDAYRIDFETRVMLEWYDMKSTYDAFYKERDEVLAG